MSKEFDITNKSLEEYLNSIEDPTKKELLQKYFYLPFELIPEEYKINNLDPVKQAEIMSKLSNEELKDIVNKMEAKIPELKNKKEQEYNDSFKDPDLIAAQGTDGTYGYVLSEDLNGPEFNTPEEAVKWQETNKGKREIPLYANDGKTIIGKFELISADSNE
ncbi:MAG: hypothetical protein AB7V48_17375 [Sedimentibacter sp.]